ncbi:MAG: RNA polymerase sigma factor [Spirochaetota bacterium]
MSSPRADAATVRKALDHAWRAEHGRIVAVLTRLLGSLDRAEDVLQSATARALLSWPARGVPERPGAWLTTVAKRIALDEIRARRRRERFVSWLIRESAVTAPDRRSSPGSDDPYDLLDRWPDERLKLIFLCCHPALDPDARRALTLREVCGIATNEVAAAYLVRESAMAQRLVRAKRTLRESRAEFDLPGPDALEARLSDVLSVVYLLFNEGYLARSGADLLRADLCDEAIRLARIVVRDVPHAAAAEALGLLSMMLLIHSRRDARASSEGLPVVLEEQDRGRWRSDEVAEGLELLDRAVDLGRPGPLQLKAAIQAVHHTADDAAQTDWQAIHALYTRLIAFEPTNVVMLNAAVARGMWLGAREGLAALAGIPNAAGLSDYAYYHLAYARFHEESGEFDDAARALARARESTDNEAETRLIERRLEELRARA